MEVTLNAYYTLISAVVILLIGQYLVKKIRFLQDFNIPEPVVGGLLAAIGLLILHATTGYVFNFHKDLQTAFMLVFFSSIGLSANFGKLKEGGKSLMVFIVIVSLFIFVQNGVGIGIASALGLNPLIGLMAGSITLVGGHGTAAAWGQIFEQEHGIVGAAGLGMACATFGVVMGSLIGGPLARFLIVRHKLVTPSQSVVNSTAPIDENSPLSSFEAPKNERLITATNAVETLALFAACLAFSDVMLNLAKGTAYELPAFVWALMGGVIIRNFLEYVLRLDMFDRAIDVFGNASLSLFLAMALLSLKLWELAGLATPLMIILLAQTLMMALYAATVTFYLMGRNYDAAVLSAGHCGFGMGATSNALACMQAITNRYGPSHKAFLIVPMAGAFFVDLVNAVVIQVLIKLIA